MKFILSFLIVCIFCGCNRADQNNSRVYVEGKISGNNIDLTKIYLKIISNNIIVAEAFVESSGNFVLSGPLKSKTFSLEINKKIKSFSTTKQGCKISSDSMKIDIPENITYITFNEIILEP